MKSKPISPLLHGIIDYMFATVLLSLPSIIKLQKKLKLLHVMNAVSVMLYSAFSKYPPAIKQVIPLRLHKKLDCAALTLIALEIMYKEVRNNKRAVLFQGVMLTAGILTVLFTNWEADNKKN